MSEAEKLCSCGCGLPRDRPGQRYRRECHARHMRVWRAKERKKREMLEAELIAASYGKNVSRETIELLTKRSKDLP